MEGGSGSGNETISFQHYEIVALRLSVSGMAHSKETSDFWSVESFVMMNESTDENNYRLAFPAIFLRRNLQARDYLDIRR